MACETKKCKTCSRPVCKDPVCTGDDSGVSLDRCHQQGGQICRLIKDQNSLVAAVKLLAKKKCDEATTRTVLAIVEEIQPTTACPICESPGQVNKGTVKVHFAKPSDERPCGASYHSVIGGLLQVKKT